MKVTALIADNLVREVKRRSRAGTITEAIVIALKEWLAIKKLKDLNASLENRPFRFAAGYSAAGVRALNRRTT